MNYFDLMPCIQDVKAGQSIRASFAANYGAEHLFIRPNGERFVNPAMISESVGQLLSWLIMETTDFQKQALFFGVQEVLYSQLAKPRQRLDFEVVIEEFNEDLVISHANVSHNEQTILQSKTGKSVLLPLEEYQCPTNARSAFLAKKLHSSQLELASTSHAVFDYSIVEPLNEGTNSVLFANARFKKTHPIFKEHFPRSPMVPGVILMSLVGQIAQNFWMSNDDHDQNTVVKYPHKLRA